MASENSSGGTIALIILIIVILLVAGYLYMKSVWNKISFVIAFKGIDFGAINISDLDNIGQTNTKIRLGLKVSNGNNFSIPFTNLRAWLYYDNTLIAQTTEELAFKKYTVLANSNKIIDESIAKGPTGMPCSFGNGTYNENGNCELTEITDLVNVYLNPSSVQLIKEIANKTNPAISYSVKLNVFGIPFSHSDYFKAQKSTT